MQTDSNDHGIICKKIGVLQYINILLKPTMHIYFEMGNTRQDLLVSKTST